MKNTVQLHFSKKDVLKSVTASGLLLFLAGLLLKINTTTAHVLGLAIFCISLFCLGFALIKLIKKEYNTPYFKLNAEGLIEKQAMKFPLNWEEIEAVEICSKKRLFIKAAYLKIRTKDYINPDQFKFTYRLFHSKLHRQKSFTLWFQLKNTNLTLEEIRDAIQSRIT